MVTDNVILSFEVIVYIFSHLGFEISKNEVLIPTEIILVIVKAGYTTFTDEVSYNVIGPLWFLVKDRDVK